MRARLALRRARWTKRIVRRRQNRRASNGSGLGIAGSSGSDVVSAACHDAIALGVHLSTSQSWVRTPHAACPGVSRDESVAVITHVLRE
jgi:hypothetical protein